MERCEARLAEMWGHRALAPRPSYDDGATIGYLNVPTPPAATPQQLAGYLEVFPLHEVPVIAVHETWPGHHLQRFAAATSSPVRRGLYREPSAGEGWAVYAERLMASAGFFEDPASRFGYLRSQAHRAARAIMDVSVHMGEMDWETASSWFATAACVAPSEAASEALECFMEPTRSAGYLAGALAIERLRDRALARGQSLANFHAGLLKLGPVPFNVAADALGLSVDGADRGIRAHPIDLLIRRSPRGTSSHGI